MDQALVNKKQKYWRYQYRLGREYLVKILTDSGINLQNTLVLDIGCAEGGMLCAFADEGAQGIGLEISPSRTFLAARFAYPERKQKINFVIGDFLLPPFNINSLKPDLVVLRDVIEHLPDKIMAVQKIQKMMKPHSRLLMTFPPFYSPFGGHQQMLGGFLKRVPYFHILPSFFWKLIKWYITKFDSNPRFIREMEKLRYHHLSICHFKQLMKQNQFEIRNQCFFISRPSFKLRYGWPVIRGNWVGKIPVLREFMITGAFFIMETV